MLVGLIALAALAAVRGFGESVDAKARQHAERVATLTPGGGDGDGGDGGDDGGGGGLFGSVGGFFGGVADSVGGAFSWVADRGSDFGHWASESAWPFLRDYTPIGFDYGVLRAAVSTVGNIGHAITHPIETVQGLNYALSHPVSTLYTFGAQAWSSIREHPQQGLGELTFNVGSFFIPGGGETTAVRVATNAATYGSSTVSVASTGTQASQSNVPGWVQGLDSAVAWTNPVTAPARLYSELWP